MSPLNKKIVIASGIGLVAVIAVILTLVFVIKGQNNQKDINQEQTTIEGEQVSTDEKDEEEIIGKVSLKDQWFDIQDMSIVALEEVDGAIKIDTAFEIKVQGAIKLEDVERHLKVSANQSYKISEKNSSSDEEVFQLTFDQPLATGKVVSMVFDKVEKPYGFAFQTEKALKVSSIYPANDAWSVPTNSLIEIRFTKEIDASVTDYISFNPSIDGRFEVKDHLCRFIPNKELAPNTSYDVTIAEGFTQGDASLEGFNSYFETQYTDSYSDGGFSFSEEKLAYVSPEGPMVFSGYNSTYENGSEIEVLAYSIEDVSTLLAMKHINIEELMAALSAEEPKVLMGTFDEASYRSKLVVNEGLSLGYYYLMIDDGISYDGQLVHITHYNAYTIADIDQQVVWIQNDAGLSNVCTVDFGEGVSGTTDVAGVLNQSMSVPQDATILMSIETEEANTFYMELNTWSYEREIQEDYWLFLETDRQVYLPTDEAVVSGYINHKEGENPSEVTVRFTSRDVVHSEVTVPLSPLGDYVTSYAWEEFYSYGMTIEVLIGEELIQRGYISISQFEKPTFKVSVATEESVIQMGETLHIYGDASYFEGTPLQTPTINVGPSWGTSIGNGTDASIDIIGDEQGHYSHAIVPYYSTVNWRPTNKHIAVGLGDIDTYYDRTTSHYTLVPRDTMVICETEQTDKGFLTMFELNEILVDQIENTYDPYEAYKGPEVVGREATVEIYDTYYEEIYEGQKYDAIMKVFYDVYSYERHKDLVHNATYTSNEYGKIAVPYNNTEEGHSYEVRLTTVDSSGESIVETESYGEYWYNDRSYSANTHFGIESDKYECALGEEVTAYLTNNYNRYQGDEKSRTLFMTVEDGIEMVSVVEGTSLTFNYPSELVTGVEVKAVYYNGHSIRQVYGYYNQLRISHESRTLNLDVEVEKDHYKPGDTVEGTVTVAYEDGKPAHGFVDMKVVDEAYYALFDDYYDPLSDLLAYRYNNQLIGEAYASSNKDDGFYGAEGGEGGEGVFRSDFKNTAYADHLMLNDEGVAGFSYELPDNLTQWRMTFGAIDPKVFAGTAIKTIDGTLPFHISLMSAEAYTEGDVIGITIKSGSKELTDTDVNYYIEVMDGQNQVYETETVGDVQGYAYVPIGQLELGSYDLKISAKAGGYSDAIMHEIQVVESRQHVPMVIEDILHENMTVTHNNQLVRMQFMNDLAWERYLMLRNLLGGDKERTEYAVASFMARKYMEINGFDFPNFEDDQYEPFIGRGNNELYKPLENSDGTVMATVDILEMGWLTYMDDYEKDRLIEAFKQQIEVNEGSYSDDAGSLYALALLGEPVLLQLRELLTMASYTDDVLARMYLIKGLTALGDYSTAMTYLDDQLTRTGEIKADAILMTIYTDLNRVEQSGLIYERIRELTELEDPVVAQAYYYLTHLPTNILDISFEMAYGEHREVIQLDYNDMHNITLASQDAETLSFADIDGTVRVITHFIGDYKDVQPSEGLTISSMMINDQDKGIGDEITFRHHVEVSNGMRSFAIHDVIPAGTVMIGKPYFAGNSVKGSVYLDNDGKNSTFYGYVYRVGQDPVMPSSYSFDITYSVRATSIGDYIYEPVVLQDYKNHSLAVGDELLVSIVE